MNLISDANSIISALIKEGKSSEILINPMFDFSAPSFLYEEIKKHEKEIIHKTHRSEQEFYNILNKINELINIYPLEYFDEFIEEAKIISPDPDDVMYFALALETKLRNLEQ